MEQVTIRLTLSCKGKKPLSISRKKEMETNEMEQLFIDTKELKESQKNKKMRNGSKEKPIEA